MDKKKIQAGFKPQARILELLGDQLIRNHWIALFELVKNAFDADAPEVTVRFLNIEDPDNASLEIHDSGEGMDLDTILHVWLEPASDHKAVKRSKGERTTKFNRLPVGEKGVGRFAVQKLGNRITLITRRKNEPEYKVTINWDILKKYRYLSEVPLEVISREPKIFKGEKTGTLIRIKDIRQRWKRGDIRRLHRSVNAMVSPYKSDDPFVVNFELKPDPGDWLAGMFSPEKAEQYILFYFDFLLDDDGFQWEYRYTPFPGLQADFRHEIKPRKIKRENDPTCEFFSMMPPTSGGSWARRKKRSEAVSLEKLGIGPILGQLVVFDLDRELKARYMPDSSALAKFLKQQGGMRVYRDGMRVYDYGEPGNDWLALDARRVQTPTRRLSNNLFLGEIHLDLASSSKLIEKTNREGFVEDQTYEEFRYAVTCALTTFEAERQKDKRIIRDCFKLTKEERKSHFQGPEEAIDRLRKKVLQEGLTDTLGSYVDRVEKTYIEARDTLMTAVGAGMGLAMVFHELERGIRGLHDALAQNKPVEELQSMSENLVNLFKGAAFLIKQNKPESFKASTLVNHALFATISRFEYHKIELVNGFDNLPEKDFTVKGARRMLMAALTNIIDNAIHWIKISRTGGDNKTCIWIGPSHDLEGPSILVADSGPGFQDLPEEIIRPFFTRKEEGMGLGLYYADMAMKANKGRLAFPENNDVDIPKRCIGAVVAMVFPGGKK